MVPNRSVRTDTQAFRSAARASWGWLVARGALALLFGVFAFVFPGAAFVSLAVGFGVYAFVDGITTLIAGFSSRSGGVRWSLVLSGVLGVLVGVVTFTDFGGAALALVWLVAAWALARGVLELIAAVRWRAEIPGAGEWLVGLNGLLLVVLGGLLALNPPAGGVIITYFVGAYAAIAGVTLIALGFRVRRL